jgi:hypothetical protein
MFKKPYLYSLAGAAFVTLASLSPIFPATATAAALSCPTTVQFQTFTQALQDAKAQNDSGASTAGIKAELNARKAFLQATLDCADKEAETLRKQLAGTKTDDQDIANLAALLTSRLAETSAYYAERRGALETVGVRGSQDAARTLRDWRAGVFAPLSANISNVLLWVKDRDLLKTAGGRFDEVGHTMGILKLSDNSDLQASYDAAASNLAQAKEAQTSARNILLLQVGSQDDALAKIKECLDNLSQMYKNFFTISETVNKLLTK